MNARKTFKVSDLIEAIKKNKIPWTKGAWFTSKNGELLVNKVGQQTIIQACVLGIGAINLGATHFYRAGISYDPFQQALGYIMRYNDNDARTWEQARDYAVEQLTPLADREFTATPKKYRVKRGDSNV